MIWHGNGDFSDCVCSASDLNLVARLVLAVKSKRRGLFSLTGNWTARPNHNRAIGASTRNMRTMGLVLTLEVYGTQPLTSQAIHLWLMDNSCLTLTLPKSLFCNQNIKPAWISTHRHVSRAVWRGLECEK